MIIDKIKSFFELIKRKWIDWIFYLSKRYFIAYISYSLFKWGISIEFIKDTIEFICSFYENPEKLYLTFYVSILFALEAIVYFLLGVIIEWYITRWIKRNENKLIKKEIFEGISFWIKSVFRLVVFKFKIVKLESLEEIKLNDGAEVPANEREKIWKEIVNAIKQLLGFVVLGFLTALIEWNSLLTYWVFGIIFTFIILFCIGVLIVFYVFVENLDKVLVLVEFNAQAILRHGKKLSQK